MHNKLNKSFNTFLCSVLLATSAVTYADISTRADSHAPIGVMGDHMHSKDEMMLSYRIMQGKKSGLKYNGENVSATSVFTNNTDLMHIPHAMEMQMHMFGMMYGLTDDITLNIMLPFVVKNSKMQNKMNHMHSMEADGIADVKLGAMHRIYTDATHHLQFNLALVTPTGKINATADNNSRLAYAMQTGSGSYGIDASINYSQTHEKYSWGGQASVGAKINTNKYNYKWGNTYNATTWIAYLPHHSISISSRLAYSSQDEIIGADTNLKPQMSTAADTDNYGGEQLSLGVGVNYLVVSGYFKNNRIALEFSQPLSAKLNGIQLEQQSKVTLGWQRTL